MVEEEEAEAAATKGQTRSIFVLFFVFFKLTKKELFHGNTTNPAAPIPIRPAMNPTNPIAPTPAAAPPTTAPTITPAVVALDHIVVVSSVVVVVVFDTPVLLL
jgi:hypothetical protein